MQKVTDADCLNDQLQDIMQRHFKYCADEYRINLLLLQDVVSSDTNKSGNELAKEFSGNDKIICCHSLITEVTDHRILSDGSMKKLYWLMICEKDCETNQILARIILDELAPKFSDMVLIEDLKGLALLGYGEKKNKRNFFFGNLLHRNWLIRKYVKTIIKSNNLPDAVSFIQLSSMTYEKSTVKTKLFFSEEAIPPDRTQTVYFRCTNRNEDLVRYKSKKLRVVRKLMELSGADAGLWVRLPKYEIEGSISEKSLKSQNIDKVSVEFDAFQVWSISKNKEKLLTYREGNYMLPMLQPEGIKYAELNRLKDFLIQNGKSDKCESICNTIINLASICQHGSSVIFMDYQGIIGEIDKRLSKNKRAFKVEKIPLAQKADDIPKGITTIDGALFSDFDGNCYAVGAIVDGEIIVKGDFGRGARYNSLKNYVTVYKKKYPKDMCIAVIFSEDGMINIIWD